MSPVCAGRHSHMLHTHGALLRQQSSTRGAAVRCARIFIGVPQPVGSHVCSIPLASAINGNSIFHKRSLIFSRRHCCLSLSFISDSFRRSSPLPLPPVNLSCILIQDGKVPLSCDGRLVMFVPSKSAHKMTIELA